MRFLQKALNCKSNSDCENGNQCYLGMCGQLACPSGTSRDGVLWCEFRAASPQ